MTETLTALPGALLLLAAMLAIVWSLAAAAGLNDLAAWATKRVKAWAARRRARRDLRAYPPPVAVMRGGHPVYRDEPFASMHWLGLTRAQQDTIIAAACVDDLEESAITRDGRWFLVPHAVLLPYIRPMGKGTRPTSVHRKAYDQRIGNLRALGIVRSQRDRQGILWIRADAVAWAHQHRPGTVERRQQHTKEEAGSAPPLPAKIKGDRVKESKPRTPENDATPTRPVVAS